MSPIGHVVEEAKIYVGWDYWSIIYPLCATKLMRLPIVWLAEPVRSLLSSHGSEPPDLIIDLLLEECSSD